MRLSVFERNVLRRIHGTRLGVKDMPRNQIKFFSLNIVFQKKDYTGQNIRLRKKTGVRREDHSSYGEPRSCIKRDVEKAELRFTTAKNGKRQSEDRKLCKKQKKKNTTKTERHGNRGFRGTRVEDDDGCFSSIKPCRPLRWISIPRTSHPFCRRFSSGNRVRSSPVVWPNRSWRSLHLCTRLMNVCPCRRTMIGIDTDTVSIANSLKTQFSPLLLLHSNYYCTLFQEFSPRPSLIL